MFHGEVLWRKPVLRGGSEPAVVHGYCAEVLGGGGSCEGKVRAIVEEGECRDYLLSGRGETIRPPRGRAIEPTRRLVAAA
jgi:hypothetical protein